MPVRFANIEEEYKKNKELKKEDVRALKEWTEKQPHLPTISELQLILFLHSCYYSNETAKATIDTFYTVKTHCPEVFANRNPLDAATRDIFISLYAPLAAPTNDGCTVFYGRLLETNPDKYSTAVQFKCFDMAVMLKLAQDGTSAGHVFVSDFSGVTLSHLTRANILIIRKFMYYLQEAMPVRIKGLHCINIVPFMDKVMALFKPFLKKETIEMLHLHSKLETLFPYVPKKCLPRDFGGESPSIKELFETQKENFDTNAQYFVEEEGRVVDESRRPGKPKNAGEIFGVEGTFKKLDID